MRPGREFRAMAPGPDAVEVLVRRKVIVFAGRAFSPGHWWLWMKRGLVWNQRNVFRMGVTIVATDLIRECACVAA